MFVIRLYQTHITGSSKEINFFFKGATWDGDQELSSQPQEVVYANDVDFGFFERLGSQTEEFFERFFTAWGTYCAQNPWLVLFFGFCFVCAMGHGIKYLNVVTDPVELWAAPLSRSRIEREFFDSNFEPFYRIEQVRISVFCFCYGFTLLWNEINYLRFNF